MSLHLDLGKDDKIRIENNERVIEVFKKNGAVYALVPLQDKDTLRLYDCDDEECSVEIFRNSRRISIDAGDEYDIDIFKLIPK